MSYVLIGIQCTWKFSKILILSAQMIDFYILLTCFCLHYSIAIWVDCIL